MPKHTKIWHRNGWIKWPRTRGPFNRVSELQQHFAGKNTQQNKRVLGTQGRTEKQNREWTIDAKLWRNSKIEVGIWKAP